MTAYLIVQAKVPETDRTAFDHWYENEHLPDAMSAFKAISASRGWSDDAPGTHYAFYEFADLATAKAIVDSSEIKGMIEEFDRVWKGRVTRTRDIVVISQKL